MIVGAHYDTKDAIPGFVGANDGASGVAVLLELARALPRRAGRARRCSWSPSTREEARGDRDFDRDGTRGSRQYVEYARAGGEQGSVPLAEIRAMVLFDLVGDCDLQIPLRAELRPGPLRAASRSPRRSSTATRRRFSSTASPVDDDHVPFLEAGIPAVDLIDFAYGPGAPPGGYWHTPEDTLDKVCPASLEKVGETALRAIPRIR